MKFKAYLNENQYKIYLDMDGVLTDFKAMFKDIDGRSTEEIEKEGDEVFWKHVDDGGLKFWSDMYWVKGSKKLWNYVKNKNVSILSAPARRLPDSVKGKQIWISRELKPIPNVIFTRARNKKEYANSNSILIDDLEKNIKQWKAAGGIGILFKSANQTIGELKKIGI